MKEYQDQFNQRKDEMEKRIEALKTKNTKLRNESQEEEGVKKKLVRRYEMDVESEIRKYDTAIKEMAYNLNEHQEGFKKEQKQLMELREHFSKVDSEKQCIENEEGLSDARRAKLEYEKSRRHEASALVQAFWRGIIQREQYQVMKKNKKKKGKKKGK